MMEITLPWPDPELSPNSHISRYDKAEAVRVARLEALVLARNAGAHLVELPEGRIGMTIIFHFPDDRRRDIDNCLASMRAALTRWPTR